MSNINEIYPQRTGLITASKAFDVMAKGKGNDLFGQMAKTYAEDLARMRLGVLPDEFETFAMTWGIEHEYEAREIYERSRGVVVNQPGFIVHPDYDFIGCTPDGMIGNVPDINTPGLIEIKCPQQKAHFEYLRKGIPQNTSHRFNFK